MLTEASSPSFLESQEAMAARERAFSSPRFLSRRLAATSPHRHRQRARVRRLNCSCASWFSSSSCAKAAAASSASFSASSSSVPAAPTRSGQRAQRSEHWDVRIVCVRSSALCSASVPSRSVSAESSSRCAVSRSISRSFSDLRHARSAAA